MFLREPLLDWQREGRLLKDARVGDTKEASGAEDHHIAAKVCTLLSGVVVNGHLRNWSLQHLPAAGKQDACEKGRLAWW